MEIWKDIKGYEGLYQVSNLGRVRGVEKLVRSKHSSIKTVKARLLNSSSYKSGYKYVTLSSGGFRRKHKIHRLVATAFIPNTQNKREVNHLNGIKSDNRRDNLEWCTSSENQKHAFKIGLQVCMNHLRVGANNPNSRCVDMFSQSGVLIRKYDSMASAARDLKVSKSPISQACRLGNIKVRGYVFKYAEVQHEAV